MAASALNHRAICAGLSCGIGLAMPVVAYAATLPFGSANSAIIASGMPFALGTAAGVALYAVSLSFANRREEAGFASSTAAPFNERADHRGTLAAEEPKQGLFGKRFNHAGDGVPVIQRASGSLSADNIWKSLEDEEFSSCDPAAAKDVYQLAIEELERDRTGTVDRADVAAAARAAASSMAIPAGTTAAFIALAASMSGSSPAKTAVPASTEAEAELTALVEDIREEDTAAQVAAALASLDSFSSDLDEPEALDVLTLDASEADAPMVDYSGHEDMWAQALAILSEEAPTDTGSPAAPYIAKHAKPSVASLTMQTPVPASPERAVLVDEGARATQFHSHVNELVEEELTAITSKSARRSSRSFLQVIQGGTAQMPRLVAEA